MGAEIITAERFVRRTQLRGDEYRKNFRQIDGEIIGTVTSTEADAVTPLMSKIYLRMANAPENCWEREGVLRFAGAEMGGRWATAWAQLVDLAGVSSATARKALMWMHEVGVIGYYAGKNGVGIRIFLNRATSSIGRRPERGQKNLRLVHASNERTRASADDTPFIAPFGGLEISEKEINPAPASGAGGTPPVDCSPAPSAASSLTPSISRGQPRHETGTETPPAGSPPLPVEEVVRRVRAELEPRLAQVAVRAAGRAAQQEAESQREWFEQRALPKAVRVAQRETFDLIRKHGLTGDGSKSPRADTEVGRRRGPEAAPEPRALSDAEVRETAETCVALFETQGRLVEETLVELSAECGGLLLPEDLPRVRAEVEKMLRPGAEEVINDGGR